MKNSVTVAALGLLSFVATSAVAQAPWNPCAGVGELPDGVICQLYSYGTLGMEMKVFVTKDYVGSDSGSKRILETAVKICVALDTPVSVEVLSAKNNRSVRFSAAPSGCVLTKV